MKKHFLVAVGCFFILLVNEQGRAQTFPGHELQAPMVQEPFVTNCWTEARAFYSLKTGDVDFCRKHMKYASGALDCYTFETQVCAVFQPATQVGVVDWVPYPEGVEWWRSSERAKELLSETAGYVYEISLNSGRRPSVPSHV